MASKARCGKHLLLASGAGNTSMVGEAWQIAALGPVLLSRTGTTHDGHSRNMQVVAHKAGPINIAVTADDRVALSREELRTHPQQPASNSEVPGQLRPRRGEKDVGEDEVVGQEEGEGASNPDATEAAPQKYLRDTSCYKGRFDSVRLVE